MNQSSAPVVIVGAGQAAGRAAQALHEYGYRGQMVMVGAEVHPPYERPPLSKGVLCNETEPPLQVLTPEQIAECGIEFVAGVRVVAIDRAAQAVTLGDGRTLHYSKCLLATGGQARALPLLPPGTRRVHYLRDLDEARRLRETLNPGSRLAVIGGGFLGLEIAASATHRGANVTVIESAPALLSRFLPPDASDGLAADVRRRGIDLRLGHALQHAVAGDTAVTLRLDGAEPVEVDHVVVAIGLEPHVNLAQAAGLDIDPRNGGIVVDPDGRTSDPSIFAAGDCASQFSPYFGAHVRMESWQNANEQARAAAAGILDRQPPARAYPWFWTDQGEHNLQMLGTFNPELSYVRRGDPNQGDPSIWIGHRAGVPVHGIALNAGGDLRALRALFDGAIPFDPASFEAQATPLRAWVKATIRAASEKSVA